MEKPSRKASASSTIHVAVPLNAAVPATRTRQGAMRAKLLRVQQLGVERHA